MPRAKKQNVATKVEGVVLPHIQGKLDDIKELKQRYLNYFARVPIQKYASMYIGRASDTVDTWKREDTQFAANIELARARFVDKNLKQTNAMFKLERIEKEIFSPRSELTGPDGEKLEGLVIIRDDGSKAQ